VALFFSVTLFCGADTKTLQSSFAFTLWLLDTLLLNNGMVLYGSVMCRDTTKRSNEMILKGGKIFDYEVPTSVSPTTKVRAFTKSHETLFLIDAPKQ
jgi:hypothetical protein